MILLLGQPWGKGSGGGGGGGGGEVGRPRSGAERICMFSITTLPSLTRTDAEQKPSEYAV